MVGFGRALQEQQLPEWSQVRVRQRFPDGSRPSAAASATSLPATPPPCPSTLPRLLYGALLYSPILVSPQHYLDYDALKRSIKACSEAAAAHGPGMARVLDARKAIFQARTGRPKLETGGRSWEGGRRACPISSLHLLPPLPPQGRLDGEVLKVLAFYQRQSQELLQVYRDCDSSLRAWAWALLQARGGNTDGHTPASLPPPCARRLQAVQQAGEDVAAALDPAQQQRLPRSLERAAALDALVSRLERLIQCTTQLLQARAGPRGASTSEEAPASLLCAAAASCMSPAVLAGLQWRWIPCPAVCGPQPCGHSGDTEECKRAPTGLQGCGAPIVGLPAKACQACSCIRLLRRPPLQFARNVGGATNAPVAGFLALEIEHPDDPGEELWGAVGWRRPVPSAVGQPLCPVDLQSCLRPIPALAAWRALQGTYLPAAVSDDLQAMQQHTALHEAMTCLQALFPEVCPASGPHLCLARGMRSTRASVPQLLCCAPARCRWPAEQQQQQQHVRQGLPSTCPATPRPAGARREAARGGARQHDPA